MLLPSDVARLVLGYLQQENLTSTCQTFILESSHLKEYAEHCTDEGFIPACLLSLFGKNLTTILNEYVAMKTKETSNHVPAIMSSLWKKLDHTLSQIRSMQSSPGFAANQRARTRSGIAEIKRQRRLASQVAPVSSELLTLPYLSGQFTTAPLTATQVIRPTGQTSVPLRSNFVVVNHTQSQDTVTTGEALNIIPGPQEKKTHANLMSPGRRKSESQRKNTTLSGPQSTIRNFQDPNAFAVEKQMVIENAREKILSNKSLQEKLAENINKFLTSDNNIAQAPKQTDSNPTEPETSIDELLGLQSEIHMSEEAIQDILEQTESDPAFQALFDLFDYGKTKNNKNLSQGMSSQHMETNPNVVLADETNLAVKGSFKTEESDDQSGQPPLCTSYQSEDTSNALKNGSSHEELRQEPQEHFSQIGSSIQKKTFKTVIPTEQKGNLDTTFESVPNLNDFNQRINSDAKCNQHCAELYTSHMSTETEVAIEVEKNSLSPNVPNESQLQPDCSDTPVTSFVALGGETKNENLTLSGKSSQLVSPNIPLPGKPSKKIQFSESSNNTGKLKTSFHGSKSPDSREIHQSKIEINDVLPVTSQQLSDCQDNSSLQSKILSVSVESSGLNVSEQQVEICLGDSVSSIKQPSSDSSCVELNQTEHEIHPSSSEKVALDSHEPSSSVKEDGDSIFLSLGENDNCGEVTLMPPEGNLEEDRHSLPSGSVCSSVVEPHPESQNTSDKPASNNSTEIDAANIVSLKIIISDDSFVSSDTELNSAVSSISGENLPTIILSSTKSPAKNAELVKCLSSEETAGVITSTEGDSVSVEQSLLALKPEDTAVNNTQSEDSIGFSASVTPCVSKDGGYIQLMPATSTTFGNSSNILIATCMTDPTVLGTTVSRSNVVVLPGNSAPITAQPSPPQLQTPPRSNNVFAVNQAVSPNFSQGSAIIIASPVQPVLQGMVGMIPVSVVGQNGNTFSAPPQQVLHMPLAAPVCNRSIPQFPLSQKSQKTQGLRNKPCTGKQVNNLADSSSHLVGCHAPRIEVSDKNMATDHGKNLEEITVPFSVENVVPTSKPFESHRRVLCFDNTVSSVADTLGTNQKTASQNKERNDISFPNLDPPMISSTLKHSSNNALKKEREKPPVPKILSKSETAISRHSTIKEVQSEKKVSPTEIGLESFHKATANKENELCSDVERQKNSEISKLSNGQQNGGLRNEKTIASLQELTKKQGTSSNSKNVISVGASVKDLKQEQTKSASSLINPLSKHPTEMLPDAQRHSPVNRLTDNTHLSVPRTPGSGAGGKHKEESTDGIKVPSSRRFTEDNSTPKVMVPPVTPDLPACSPASEAGSENSVNMAAHTLMILSRAAISRATSTTPLKDNTQQFRASSRNPTKKRKIEELDERERNSRTSNKNLPNSSIPMKKKRIKKKKLPSSFPAGMDVDKFLLSLHYDE
ncbi:nuclear protein, coactivator of histone transcription [Phyllostomus discolor]|uniref:Nuclear protein, coactivator of histone transcription n=1 Tax=Phyllostomus discolor TaxID=89673 RepID=A0A6J2LX73_9CHIR|nr:protein NPAT isoform X1 [Phyllostomus discolor]KAF6105145.1 nuclear protein, coactivator of histone transcription [Phyllostomus discolor]